MNRPRIELSEQVVRFVSKQAPESRKALRRGLRGLTREAGDIKPLEGRLEGFHRLRIGAFRILFRYTAIGGRRILRCEFAERRSIVYEAFAHLARVLRGP